MEKCDFILARRPVSDSRAMSSDSSVLSRRQAVAVACKAKGSSLAGLLEADSPSTASPNVRSTSLASLGRQHSAADKSSKASTTAGWAPRDMLFPKAAVQLAEAELDTKTSR
eukprot:CAMPEP_0206503996 /NCGR_PEP_ID=MMETSP0324_2-20121206/55148_1 /ASSEMBLY_ACC=CAM_ASM_000836 /TAXON_ID=2866 /ORGANISM="Crypthecodinium cohnii, Strain Seligo" /LENGTH=111 /DNA_ID=CAMNT_0053992933 /DNA_START=470 /DNA_END=806 /DNA_ORIENTATION=+